MKKTIVALAVAAFAATSANATTVFNQDGTKVDVNGSFRALLFKAKDNRTDINVNGSHFAFEASHDLGNGLSALGYTKVNLVDDNARNGELILDTLYAGFKFDGVGQLTFGKHSTNGDDLSLAGYDYDIPGGVNRVVTEGNKVVKFTSADFGGFKFGLDYVFADVAQKTNVTSKNRTVVLTGFYDRKFGDVGFKFNAGYSQVKTYSATVPVVTTKAYTVATEVSYAPVSFAIDFGQQKQGDEKFVGLLLGAKYQVTDAVKVYANYQTTKNKVKSKTTSKTRGYGLGVGYKLHKNVETFVEGYKARTKPTGGKATTNSQVHVGFRVHF